MIGIRRTGLLLFVLLIGIALGNLSAPVIMLITIPLVLIWIVSLDEAHDKERLRQKQLRLNQTYELKNELRR